MNESTRYWYSVSYKDTARSNAAYGSSVLSEKEIIISIQQGNYLFLEDLIFWDYDGKPKSMTEWSKTDHDRKYINPQFISSITPMRDDPRNIITTVNLLPPPKGLKAVLKRWLQMKIEKFERDNKLKT
jgi:hypothetical protein